MLAGRGVVTAAMHPRVVVVVGMVHQVMWGVVIHSSICNVGGMVHKEHHAVVCNHHNAIHQDQEPRITISAR